MTKNAGPDKYKYSGQGIRLAGRGSFSLNDGNGFGKNVIIFGADMSSSVHLDNNKKYIMILGDGPTQGSDDTTLTAKKEYAINFNEQQKKFCLTFV